MTREEVHALANLAQRLDSTLRRVLIGAAQAANHDDGNADVLRQRLRQIGTRKSALANECCTLLLTPVASYAKTSLTSALESIWQETLQAPE